MEPLYERSPELPGPQPPRPEATPLPVARGLDAASLMALQRTAGNASVTRILARAPSFPPPTKPPPKPPLDASRYSPEDAIICREAGEFVQRSARVSARYNAVLEQSSKAAETIGVAESRLAYEDLPKGERGLWEWTRAQRRLELRQTGEALQQMGKDAIALDNITGAQSAGARYSSLMRWLHEEARHNIAAEMEPAEMESVKARLAAAAQETEAAATSVRTIIKDAPAAAMKINAALKDGIDPRTVEMPPRLSAPPPGVPEWAANPPVFPRNSLTVVPPMMREDVPPESGPPSSGAGKGGPGEGGPAPAAPGRAASGPAGSEPGPATGEPAPGEAPPGAGQVPPGETPSGGGPAPAGPAPSEPAPPGEAPPAPKPGAPGGAIKGRQLSLVGRNGQLIGMLGNLAVGVLAVAQIGMLAKQIRFMVEGIPAGQPVGSEYIDPFGCTWTKINETEWRCEHYHEFLGYGTADGA